MSDMSDNNKNFPNGGFPQIFIIDTKFKEQIEKNKNREFSELKTSINIKDILKLRLESKEIKKPLFDI
jgi:hypothetical protein